MCAAVYILVFLSALVLVSSLFFLLHLAIGVLSFGVSAVAAAVAGTCLLRCGVEKKDVYGGLALAGVLVLVMMVLVGTVHDTTYDGNTYHKTAIGALANGWNPLVESSYDFQLAQDYTKGLPEYSIWVDHFAKATWQMGAGFYAVSGNIETAKVYNILGVIVLFGILQYYLRRRGLRSWQSIVIAAAACANPVAIAGVLTTYVDGFLAMMLSVVAVLSLMIFDDKTKISLPRKAIWALLFGAIIITCNIKFTGLAYCGAVCLLFFVVFIIQNFKKGRGISKPAARRVGKITLFFAGSALVAVLFVGAGTYVTNYLDHGHPLYPLSGEGSVDIMTTNSPDSYEDRGTLSKLYHSLFSESDNIDKASGMEPVLKKPFTVKPEELSPLGHEMRIAGFGPLSSGLFIICAIVMLAAAIIGIRKRNPYAWVLLAGCVLITILTVSISESWWARYSPYMYWVIPIALFVVIWRVNKGVSRDCSVCVGILSISFCFLIFLNTAFFFPYMQRQLDNSAIVSTELRAMRQYAHDNGKDRKGAVLDVCLVSYPGLAYNIKDLNLKVEYKLEKTPEMKSAYLGHIYYE
jgi:hypothetical protein